MGDGGEMERSRTRRLVVRVRKMETIGTTGRGNPTQQHNPSTECQAKCMQNRSRGEVDSTTDLILSRAHVFTPRQGL